jgi:septal ring factor EnvC (AmiA/AmiB activator)
VRERAKKERDRSRILSENRRKEKDEAEMNNNAREKQLTKEWEDRVATQEEEFGKRIFQAHNTCVQLQNERERTEAEWRGRAQAERAKHAQLVAQLQSTHRKRVQDAQFALRDADERRRHRIEQFEEMQRQILAEKDAAVLQCERRLGEVRQDDERRRAALQDEHGNKMKECTSLQKQYEQQQSDRGRLADQQDALLAQLGELAKEIARLNDEIKQKDAMIMERGAKIEEVKKENQDLEKHHQVLNHHENVLHSQMDPLDRQIERVTREIGEMDRRLEAANKRTTDQNQLIASMQSLLGSVIEHERRQSERLNIARTQYEQARYDLHDVVQHFHAHDELKTHFKAFYAKYVNGDLAAEIQFDEDVEAEHRRQKVTLETQVRELRVQQARDDQFQVREQGRLLLENAALIKELQALRNANRELVTASQLYRKTASDLHFLPATEAQKAIQENKARITKMEQQLVMFSSILDG